MSDDIVRCTAIIEARLIELIQAIDDLRRSFEERDSLTSRSGGVSWNEYEQYG